MTVRKCLWFIWLVFLPVWGAQGAVTSVTDGGKAVIAPVLGKNKGKDGETLTMLEQFSQLRRNSITELEDTHSPQNPHKYGASN